MKPGPASDLHYESVASGFDRIAADYDDKYDGDGEPVISAIRNRNLQYLQSNLPTVGSVLEIGCGTGIEAAVLANNSRHVVATDISERMLCAARVRAVNQGIDGQIRFHQLAARDIGTLVDTYSAQSQVGAYSSFGPLNCERDLPAVADGLSELLAPGCPFIASVANRFCAFEIVWHLMHMKFRTGLRRIRRHWSRGSLASRSGDVSVPVRALTARELERAFAPQFELREVVGLNVFLPPPYMRGFASKHRRTFSALLKLEKALADRAPFSHLGDHLLLLFRRGEA